MVRDWHKKSGKILDLFAQVLWGGAQVPHSPLVFSVTYGLDIVKSPHAISLTVFFNERLTYSHD